MSRVSTQWRQNTHKLSDPSPVDKLLTYIQCQRKAALDDRLIISNKQDKPSAKHPTRELPTCSKNQLGLLLQDPTRLIVPIAMLCIL